MSFSNAWKWKVKAKLLSCVRLLATPRTAAYQAPPSMGFSRQEYWSGVPLPSPRHTLTKTTNYIIPFTDMNIFKIMIFKLFIYLFLAAMGAVCSVQFSRVRLFVTPWTAACQASLSITNSQSLLKLMSIESVMPSNHLILCCPLLLPSIFSIRVFSNELVLHIRWPEYWSFSFSISPSNEYSGLISFRIDCLDLLAVQGTLQSLLQHHSSKASILWLWGLCEGFL